MFVHRLIDLPHDRRGVVSLYFAFVITAMVLLALAALDFLRVGMIRSRTQSAMDAAVIAAGRNLSAGQKEWEADAKAYFNANMGNAMGATIVGPTVVPAPANTPTNVQEVTLTASVSIPVLSGAFTQANAMTMDISTTARKTTRANVELVMAMDNTGSMWGTKLTAAQSAAQRITAAMLGNNSGGNNTVGLVPFTETVNVGNNALTRTWVDWNKDAGHVSETSWSGCLFERYDSEHAYSVESTPPTEGHLFRAYRDHRAYSKGTCDSSDCEEFSWSEKWLWGTLTHSTHVDLYTSSDSCISATTQFLTSNQATIDTAINNMVADGNTTIASGAMWGWRMLSPAWRGSWDAAAVHPMNSGTGVSKVLVLLTDGDNTTTNTGSSYMMVYHTTPWGDIRGTGSNTILSQYCTAIKNDGITVFTIPFGDPSDIDANTEKMLRECATDTSKYFRVTDETNLDGVFDTIVAAVSEFAIVR